MHVPSAARSFAVYFFGAASFTAGSFFPAGAFFAAGAFSTGFVFGAAATNIASTADTFATESTFPPLCLRPRPRALFRSRSVITPFQNKMKREAGGQGEFSGEFSVGLAACRDVVSQPAT
jgi:hypothetical protein